jgi:hypothetical protein
MKRSTCTHAFVEFIPEKLDEGVVYVSIPYTTAVHKCFCGCGREVVTPISPVAWHLTFDGKTISLNPSIGSWALPCQSHYFVRRDRVLWARRWSKEQIDAGREHERLERQDHFSGKPARVPKGTRRSSLADGKG